MAFATVVTHQSRHFGIKLSQDVVVNGGDKSDAL